MVTLECLHAALAGVLDYHEKILYLILGPILGVRLILECHLYSNRGVTLPQLVKASVGQADVQRFEPHLGHN